uniref:Uncharacterized protein n=1 Tax=Lepeophtheirus salmonis TaxID=72036 RepID=A0A0K2TQL2_LEPSM
MKPQHRKREVQNRSNIQDPGIGHFQYVKP